MSDNSGLNWLDRLVSYFFPEAGQRRLEARRELAKAEAAQDTAAAPRHGAMPQRERDAGGWQPYDEQRVRERWESRRR